MIRLNQALLNNHQLGWLWLIYFPFYRLPFVLKCGFCNGWSWIPTILHKTTPNSLVLRLGGINFVFNEEKIFISQMSVGFRWFLHCNYINWFYFNCGCCVLLFSQRYLVFTVNTINLILKLKSLLCHRPRRYRGIWAAVNSVLNATVSTTKLFD